MHNNRNKMDHNKRHLKLQYPMISTHCLQDMKCKDKEMIEDFMLF